MCESIFGHDAVYTKYMVQVVTLLSCIWEVPTYPDQAFCWFFSVVGGYQNFLGTSCLHLQDFCSEDGDRMLVPPTR
jgi:hypothetical protein